MYDISLFSNPADVVVAVAATAAKDWKERPNIMDAFS